MRRVLADSDSAAFSRVPVAFVGTEAGSITALEDIVIAQGLTVPTGLDLSNVLAASVLRLPVSAYGI